ncbi:tetratricopeptide repeat protein [Roseovarius aestuarii]|uniref:Photosystem I assembly protein Ycf3 n=1 Tax=Roseovarius aestuarii TaxID=475083 RepID=A0A1X7BLB2_9RHOB|nr:tetratricopeptide repeat protein [Roseovarius aestuarii]SMC10432.1 photosystem I assembly protein Ycf3 [Roseovarius aestuarii]
MIDTIWVWAVENAVAIGLIAGVVAIVEFSLKPFRAFFGLFKIPPKLDLSEDTIGKLKADTPEHGPRLTVSDFIRIRRELKEELQAELDDAAQEDRTQLRARIAELESQIANPEKALAEAQTRIAELESLLEREGNEIGADRIADAIAALEKGDYSIAKDLFAEIEARAQPDVQRAARAAYGQGEVAEAEIRWHDAAEHYRRAAQLNPTYDSLAKAGVFLRRDGRYKDAIRFEEDLVAFARQELGDDDPKTATALSNLAESLRGAGEYDRAEKLLNEALEIDKATIGERHPDYATDVNNLAAVLRVQGRNAEAEKLYRQALEIGKATIGEGHPFYATCLNNLALAVEGQGRHEEAEGLYRQALEIDKATIGEGHPNYAIDLNNLAGVVETQGRYEEAERLYRQALEIFEKSLGPEHPNTIGTRSNLDELRAKKSDNVDL